MRRFRDFSRQSRNLRASSCGARRARLESLRNGPLPYMSLAQDETTADVHSLCGRALAVSLRSVLRQFCHFETAYGNDSCDPPHVFPSGLGLDVTVEEVGEAISSLKAGKVVPEGSLPTLPRVILVLSALGTTYNSHAYPPEISECALSLLPKLGKSSRMPKDLRPLGRHGLQDRSAKIFATVLKHMVMEQARTALKCCPQYAYSKGKAIDEAILRVGDQCRLVRTLLPQSTLSIHAKRAGGRASSCHGGVTLSLDLSKAFDCVPRWAMVRSLDHDGVSKDLQAAILSIHERCKYHIQHGPYKRAIDMKKSICQVCALSPCPYSTFTVWLSDLLASR